MLRCFGIPVQKPTRMFGDNKSVLDSVNILQSEMKKKHIVISYHLVREAIAARIIDAPWIMSHENYADVLTKALGTILFNQLICELMD